MYLYWKLILLCLICSITGAMAQADLLSVHATNQPLKNILIGICDQANLEFVVDDRLIADQNVTIQFNFIPFDSALGLILGPADLKFKQLQDSVLVIYTKSSQKIEGYVQDAIDGKPLAHANVFYPGTRLGTTTDGSGYFTLAQPNDQKDLKISFIGYKEASITDANIWSKPQNIKLEPEILELDSIKIEGHKSFSSFYYQPDFSISLEIDPRETPSIVSGDIQRTIELTPGIHAVPEYQNGYYLNGANPSQVGVYFDGIPVFHQQHFNGLTASLSGRSIDTIEIFDSNSPVSSADRLGGQINLYGKTESDSLPTLGIDLDYIHVGANIGLKSIKKLQTFISLRRSFNPVLHPMIENQTNSFLYRKEFGEVKSHYDMTYFLDATIKNVYSPTKDDRIAISLFYTSDHYDNQLIENMEKEHKNTQFNRGIGISWHHVFQKENEFKLGVYQSDYKQSLFDIQMLAFVSEYSNFSSKISHFERTESLLAENHLINKGIKMEWKLNSFAQIHAGAGFDHYYSSTMSSNLFDFIYNGSNSYYNSNMFLELEKRIFPGILATTGIRFCVDKYKKYNLLPRLSVSWNPLRHITFFTNFAKTSQPLHQIKTNENFVYLPTIWTLAQKTTPKSTGRLLTAGFNSKIESLSINGRLYASEMQNIPFFDTGIDSFQHIPIFMPIIGMKQTIKGGRIEIMKRFRDLSLSLIYNKSSVVMHNPNYNNGFKFYADHDRSFETKFKLVFTPLQKIAFGMTWVYAGGQLYTPITQIHSNRYLTGKEHYFLHNGPHNSQRYDNYSRLDISFTKSFKNFFRTSGYFGLSVINVLGQNNISRQYYTIPKDNTALSQYNYYSLGFLPILFANFNLAGGAH